MARATEGETTEEERPTKRARVSVDEEQGGTSNAEPATLPETLEEDEDMEEELDAEDSEVKASDLYLDTASTMGARLFSAILIISHQINRAILDFDFEKVCSVSLSNINIYGCLVCGKYFQGRGRKSYAYAHSIHEDHHVFINLETTKVRHTRLTLSDQI